MVILKVILKKIMIILTNIYVGIHCGNKYIHILNYLFLFEFKICRTDIEEN